MMQTEPTPETLAEYDELIAELQAEDDGDDPVIDWLNPYDGEPNGNG